jgi:predicted TIM-barrel fold metal-dependent hydrolase
MLDQPDVRSLFPAEGLGRPTERQPQREGDAGLAPDTVVVSADSHISLTEDIWYERFPARLKDKAPRIWHDGRGYQFGSEAKPLIHEQVRMALEQYEDLPGCQTSHMDARMADLDAEGIEKELVFPNAMQILFAYPDLEVRELCFRIFNEYLAELQAKAPGRFYGVGLINWWDPKGCRSTLEELKALGLKTYLLPMKTASISGAPPIDWTSDAMRPVWEEIEAAGLPVSHHIGEAPQLTQYNFLPIGFVFNAGTFREMFSKYVFGGILDRHPTLQVGWYEGGINWVPATLQDADLALASYRYTFNWDLQHEPAYYWRKHMFASFIIDPLGLEMIDRIGADRVMWSADYPHAESSFGYTRSSLKQVADIVGEASARAIVGGNAIRLLGL